MDWVDRILINFKSNAKTMKYLIMDKCTTHKKESVLQVLKNNKVLVSLIPGGGTSIFQPLYVCINKPFKNYIRANFDIVKLVNIFR